MRTGSKASASGLVGVSAATSYTVEETAAAAQKEFHPIFSTTACWGYILSTGSEHLQHLYLLSTALNHPLKPPSVERARQQTVPPPGPRHQAVASLPGAYTAAVIGLRP